MHKNTENQAEQSQSSGLFAVAMIAALTMMLGGCATSMPSFGLGAKPNQTAALPAQPAAGYTSNSAPGAAYGRRGTRARTPRGQWGWSKPSNGSKLITIRRGDTLYRVATRRGVAVSELMAANQLRDPHVVPGQQLLVPRRRGESAYERRPNTPGMPTGQPPRRASLNKYGSRAQDNNYQTPRVYQYNTRQYDARSSGTRSSAARPARRLFERSNEPLNARSTFGRTYASNRSGNNGNPARTGRIGGARYRVQAGDTLYSIARRTGVSPARLASHNALINPSRLPTGTLLAIPR